jgi:hypothetical protein
MHNGLLKDHLLKYEKWRTGDSKLLFAHIKQCNTNSSTHQIFSCLLKVVLYHM